MSEFWLSGTGVMPTGSEKDSFVSSFEIIPDGTCAYATIKSFLIVSKNINGAAVDYYEVTWKITSEHYRNREVTQKIKVFDSKPEARQRALNMLKRIYDLCNFRLSHNGAPSDDDHKVLIGKNLGIKISEWQMPKKDGSGFMEGNHVSEVHKIGGEFVLKEGVKKESPKMIDASFGTPLSVPPAYDPNDIPY